MLKAKWRSLWRNIWRHLILSNCNNPKIIPLVPTVWNKLQSKNRVFLRGNRRFVYKSKIATKRIVCYTAVFSVVTQRSSPLTAAEKRTTFLSLCVCGLSNKPIMTIREPQGARSEHASQFSTNQSIVAEFWWTLCLQAMKRLFAGKFVLSG